MKGGEGHMTCKAIEERIDDYLDGLLSVEEISSFEAHLATCDACRESVEASQMVLEALKELPSMKLPEGFEAELHEALLEAKEEMAKPEKLSVMNKFKSRTKAWQRGLSYVAATFIIGFVGLSAWSGLSGNVLGGFSKSSNDMTTAEFAMSEPEMSRDMADGLVAPASPEAPQVTLTMKASGDSEEMVGAPPISFSEAVNDGNALTGNTTSQANDLQARKLIKNGQIHLEVLAYDEVVARVQLAVEAAGGYVENSQTGTYTDYYRGEETKLKEGYMTIRIPATQFEGTLKDLEALGEVIYTNQNTSDITNQYRDTVNEVKNLEVREEALRKIMEKAETVGEVIEVERELSYVRASINSLMGNLQQWDRLVDLATIQLNIRQVRDLSSSVEPIDKNVFQRSKEAFVRTVNRMIEWSENVFVSVIGGLPIWLPILIVITFVWLFFRRHQKRSVKK